MVVLVFVAVIAAAAHQAVTRSQAVDAAAERHAAVTAAVTQADMALAGIVAAERSYVAPGQGLDFWAARVDEALAAARHALGTLQSQAADEAATAAVAAAASRLDDFAEMDQRARDYTRDGQRTLASDLIFADGFEIAAAARTELASAAALQRAAIDAPLTRDRQLRLASFAVLGAAGLLAALLLLRMPKPEEPVVTSIAPDAFAPATAIRAAAVPDDSIGAALDASLEGLDAFDSPARPEPVEPVEPFEPFEPVRPASVNLASTADVCVDLARLLDARDLQNVLGRIGDVLGASGVIVWLSDAEGLALAPALTHGYAPSLVARLGTLPAGADNPTSAAWRSKTTQVVNGALAVPLLTAEGCTGVLALELKDGKERASDVQSLARIVGAQLAAGISAPASESRRAAEA